MIKEELLRAYEDGDPKSVNGMATAARCRDARILRIPTFMYTILLDSLKKKTSNLNFGMGLRFVLRAILA